MAAREHTWINGQRAEALPLPDRALDYGDGLFETLLVVAGRPLFLPLHIDRLAHGMARLGFPDCMARIRSDLEHCLSQLGNNAVHTLRLTLSRGAGPRGYAPPVDSEPLTIIRVAEYDADWRKPLDPLRVSSVELALASQPRLAGIKHLNRLEQVLALAEAHAKGADEALLCDAAGRPVCLASANLFLVKGGQVYTSPLLGYGIAGTRRRALVERWAPRLGIEVREVALDREDLSSADEIFASNSVIGLRAVAEFNGRTTGPNPVMEALFAEYLKDAAS